MVEHRFVMVDCPEPTPRETSESLEVKSVYRAEELLRGYCNAEQRSRNRPRSFLKMPREILDRKRER